MKVIVDTNVVVSAVLRGGKPATLIEFLVAQPDVEWVGSHDIVAEYVDVLGRPKFGLPNELHNEWADLFEDCVSIVTVNVQIHFPRDQKDAKFLACALEADADYLVTGDRDFEEAKQLANTRIVSVSQFIVITGE